MRNKYILIGLVGIAVGVLLASVVVVLAGTNLDAPSGPTDSASQMYTLAQVYDRANNGAAATKMTTFDEPDSGPAATMYDLNALYTLVSERSRPAKTGDTYTYEWVTGEDGELQKGVTWPTPRFTDNNNGTVTDNLTGLIWLKDADCMGSRTWSDALTQVGNLNSGTNFNCDNYTAGTFSDWRLPNMRELQSLIHYGVYNPAVPNTAGTGKWTSGDPFTGVQSGDYWSSTTDAICTDARYVDLLNGCMGSLEKTNTYYVWPVRGGE